MANTSGVGGTHSSIIPPIDREAAMPTTPQPPNPLPINGSTTITAAVAAPIIGSSQPSPTTEKPASLAGRATTRENEGSIPRFFRRLFSKISDKEQEDGRKIKGLINDITNNLNSIDRLARVLAHAGKNLPPFISQDSESLHSAYVEQMGPFLDNAERILGELLKLEEQAQALAEEHTTFNDLPGNIRKLKDKIELLKAQREFSAELHAVGSAMKDYFSDRKWENFAKVQKRKADLNVKLLFIFHKYPNLQANPKVQTYLQKKTWSGIDVYQLIQVVFPDLKSQAERLKVSTLEMSSGRIANLKHQTEILKNSIPQYKAVSKKIRNVEWWINKIQNKSWIGKIYKMFHSHSLLNLKKELAKLEKDRQAFYDKIESNKAFNPKELNWLEKQAFLDFNVKNLRTNIKTSQKQLGKNSDLIAYQQRVFVLTSRLIKHLAMYQRMKREKVDQGTLNSMKASISLGMQEFAEKFRHRRLKNEDQTINIQRLREIINLHYPYFQDSTEILFRFISKAGLNDEINRILSRPRQSVATPPSDIPAPPPFDAPPMDAPPSDIPPPPPFDAPPLDIPPLDESVLKTSSSNTTTPSSTSETHTSFADQIAAKKAAIVAAKRTAPTTTGNTNAPNPTPNSSEQQEPNLLQHIQARMGGIRAVSKPDEEEEQPPASDDDWN